MATFLHMDGLQGVNLDLVTHWEYTEVTALPGKRPAGESEPKSPGAMGPHIRVAFSGGQHVEWDGPAAQALHAHFCTYSRSLT